MHYQSWRHRENIASWCKRARYWYLTIVMLQHCSDWLQDNTIERYREIAFLRPVYMRPSRKCLKSDCNFWNWRRPPIATVTWRMISGLQIASGRRLLHVILLLHNSRPRLLQPIKKWLQLMKLAKTTWSHRYIEDNIQISNRRWSQFVARHSAAIKGVLDINISSDMI